MSWKDLFYFSKSDRVAFTIILVVISVSCLIIVLPKATKSQTIEATVPIPSQDSFPILRKENPSILSKKTSSLSKNTQRQSKLKKGETIEINGADTTELKKVPGIGSSFARRIVKYRELLGGYYTIEQLQEVYGMDENKYTELKDWFVVNNENISRLSIHSSDFKTLLRHPYLSKEQVQIITSLLKRDRRIEGIEDLGLLEEFTSDDLTRLRPYLSFD